MLLNKILELIYSHYVLNYIFEFFNYNPNGSTLTYKRIIVCQF